MFAESLIEAVPVPMALLERTLRIRLANSRFKEMFRGRPAPWKDPGLRQALEAVADGGGPIGGWEVDYGTRKFGVRKLSITARAIAGAAGPQLLLAIEDVTDQRKAEQQREQAESALRHNREQLTEVTARLLKAQDSERRRLSRELHDGLTQKVAKLQFDLERLEQESASQSQEVMLRFESLKAQAGELADEVRQIAYRLHPSVLDHLGLAIALRSYCRDFADQENLPVRFSSVHTPKKIPAGIASSLYRIAQEALRNVAKHAGKASVIVTLSGGPGVLRLGIRDDGPGFSPAAVEGQEGLGLVSMRERVRLLNGAFRLSSAPGQGVDILVTIPLPGESKAGGSTE